MLQPSAAPPQPPQPDPDDFLRELRHFHEARGTPFRRGPTLAARHLDLRLLYDLVTAEGGWVKVNAKNSWADLLPNFGLPSSCVNGAVALKQIYLRYLDRYEKAHLGGDEGDRAEDDDYDDDQSRHKRPGAAATARQLHAVPHHYNYQQHQVPSDKRDFHMLSTDLYPFEGWEYERLFLSLTSPLPNEQDFALNACTLLSNDGRPGRTLRLDRYPKILDHLLAHAHVYNHNSLRQLFTYYYREVRKRPTQGFWKDAIESREFLFLSRESRFCGELVDTIDLEEYFEEEDELDDESEVEESQISNKFTRCPEDDHLFSLRRALGTQDYIGQRVLQVATILRNLCYVEENVSVLAKNKTFVRFLLLCAVSRWNNLKNLALDMLGNISNEYTMKEFQNDLLSQTLLKIIVKNLCSEDRGLCISSLEVLNKLSQNDNNEDAILKALEPDTYKQVTSFLTIHDVMLLIYTLECLYALSSLGERACSHIASSRHGIVDTLVSLVTVEGKSYGPRACIGMKLVETVPSGTQSNTSQAPAPIVTAQPQVLQQIQLPLSTTSSSTTAVVTISTPAKTTTVQLNTPVRSVTMAPQRLIAATPTPVAPMAVPASSPAPATPAPVVVTSAPTILNALTPQQAIAQAHAQQQAIHEDERFALAWLRATYEPAPVGGPCPRLDHRELYRHYMSSCSQLGRRGVISPLHFPRCVRSVFGGTVGPNPMRPGTGETQFYEGIRQRAQPLIVPGAKPQPAGQQQQVITPTSQQQLQAGSTSLIKSLLATKVKEEAPAPQQQSMRTGAAGPVAPVAAQVAARQQRLQMKTNENKETNANRVNGVRLFSIDDDMKPPPLVPLSSNTNNEENLVNGTVEDEKPTLRLADLLERKCERSGPAPLMNGAHEKVDIVEDRIEKALSEEPPLLSEIKIEIKEELLQAEVIEKPSAKRAASDDISNIEEKKPKLEGALNGTDICDDSVGVTIHIKEDGEASTGVSSAAAKLFADMAADILEDEDDEQLFQVQDPPPTPQPPAPPEPVAVAPPAPSVPQFVVDSSTGQVVQVGAASSNCHIVVSQSSVKPQQAVVVQGSRQAGAPLVIQGGSGAGQLLFQTAPGGQVQIVQGAVPAQYVGGQVGQVVVQQGGGANAPKTIIILQQQQQAQQHQKVVVTPQGQQVVVTQVARPIAPAVPKKAPSPDVVEVPIQRPQRDLTTPFVCEWGTCVVETKFKSANEVYMHACATHCPSEGSEEVTCQWDGCDTMKRKRFSLMTHLHDKHCNTEAMRQSLTRRKQVAAGGQRAEPPPATPQPAQHPGYAPDAALHAIKRHALEFVNPKELQDDNEGPVTKSIRLTAALILRNLALYNGQSRRHLKAYESHLANVALSNVESSRTVAQILYDINDVSGPR